MFRPKGIAVDSEGHLYVVDGLWGIVQVFDQQGRLLYYFGGRGMANGEFQLPAGLFIDREDRIFVVDSFNRRVQVYRYFGLPKQARAGRLMKKLLLLSALLSLGMIALGITGLTEFARPELARPRATCWDRIICR